MWLLSSFSATSFSLYFLLIDRGRAFKQKKRNLATGLPDQGEQACASVRESCDLSRFLRSLIPPPEESSTFALLRCCDSWCCCVRDSRNEWHASSPPPSLSNRLSFSLYSTASSFHLSVLLLLLLLFYYCCH